MMSWSCPFHSLQLPRHVPVIFSVCPLHVPCMFRAFVASHFPTSPVVPIGFLSFVSLSFPLHAPCFHFCAFHVPFSSPLFPSHFPLLPSSSPHVLALPCISPLLPSISRKKARFFQRCRKEDVQKHRVFSIFSVNGGRKPKPAKSRQGDSSLNVGGTFSAVQSLYMQTSVHTLIEARLVLHRHIRTYTHTHLHTYTHASRPDMRTDINKARAGAHTHTHLPSSLPTHLATCPHHT